MSKLSIHNLARLAALTAGFFLPEVMLRATSGTPFFEMGLLRALLASFATAATIWAIGVLSPKKASVRALAVLALALVAAAAIAEACVHNFFGIYYQVSYMLGMGGQVAGDFAGEALGAVLGNLWLFPLALAPTVLALVFRRRLIPDDSAKEPVERPDNDSIAEAAESIVKDAEKPDEEESAPSDPAATPSPEAGNHNRRRIIIALAICLIAHAVSVTSCHVGGDIRYYTSDFTANNAIPRFGLINSLRLEAQYALFGMPGLSSSDFAEEAQGGADGSDATQPEQTAYEPNVTDIDFATLIESDTSDTLRTLDQYFSAQTPTLKNEYTGMFEGKNLIFITAEAFSYAVIDEDRTPALYELANNGFVFSNFYQPDWTQSTTGGEFAAMTGIIPTWVNGGTAFAASATNAMPYGLGWQFASRGYTAAAYHNNTYTYYGRDVTHPNLGYTYTAVGNGLELPSSSLWPASDLEMMQATIGQHISAYVEDGTPFHAYYMSVSGHCNYGWNANDMSEKNRDAVADVEASEPVQAYLACNMELEYALEYLMDELEEAGIAEDTVIVLTPDHYPYGLTENMDADYYAELTGVDFAAEPTERYRNTLIMWCGDMDEPVEVEGPCSSVDIVPTLLNLFGFEYDSRLLSGRDALAPDVEPGAVGSDMHAVVFTDTGAGSSWITAAGTYEAATGTFTAAAGVELEDEAAYVAAVSDLARNRYNMARYLVQENYYAHVFPE